MRAHYERLAGHWAPFSSTHQRWRLVYAMRGSAHWEKFRGPLIEFNQGWVTSAAMKENLMVSCLKDANLRPRSSMNTSWNSRLSA